MSAHSGKYFVAALATTLLAIPPSHATSGDHLPGWELRPAKAEVEAKKSTPMAPEPNSSITLMQTKRAIEEPVTPANPTTEKSPDPLSGLDSVTLPPAPSPLRTPVLTEPAPQPAPQPTPTATTAPVTQSAFPTKATTGTTGKLTRSGRITVRKDHTVVENLDVSGPIIIRANHVTVRNVRVRSNTSRCGIELAKGFGGALIENVDVRMGIKGRFANGGICGVGDIKGKLGKDYGDNITVRNSLIQGYADGIKAVNYALYEGNYISVTRPPKSRGHVDGIQGSGRSHYRIRGNTIEMAYAPGHNAAVFIQAFNGRKHNKTKDIRVENNFLNGGVYTFHSEDGKKGKSGFLSNIVVQDNVFGRDYKYGASRFAKGISGNSGVWADSGKQITRGGLR